MAEGRRIRRQRTPQGEPLNRPADTCPECGSGFKGDLDMAWWNDNDPTLSRWVCLDCHGRLLREMAEAAKAERQKLQPEPIKPIPLEEARRLMAEQVRIAHVCEWVYLRQEIGPPGAPSRDVFFCRTHPEHPNLQRIAES